MDFHFDKTRHSNKQEMLSINLDGAHGCGQNNRTRLNLQIIFLFLSEHAEEKRASYY